MADPDPSSFPKYTPNPYLASIPTFLKDPKNYKKVQKVIIEALASKHSHGEIVEWVKCAACQRRFHEKGDVLKKLGFQSPRHYLVWQKIMQEMMSLERDRLQ